MKGVIVSNNKFHFFFLPSLENSLNKDCSVRETGTLCLEMHVDAWIFRCQFSVFFHCIGIVTEVITNLVI